MRYSNSTLYFLPFIYRKFSIEPPEGLIVFRLFRGKPIGEGGFIEMRLNKLLKYEQIFYGDIVCIF